LIFLGHLTEKYKQVSIETALGNAASLYHQNETIFKQSKITTTMKKQIKKLAFSTEKIVSLNKIDMQAVNGGTWAPSNSGQSYNCLAITGHRSCLC
jgi:hypothetical protein